jgi:PAS domain S-box-containing protein
VVLVVDASQTLFPILTHESIPTRTGETLLVRREGDDLVFFSPLRHVPAGSPNLRFPLSTAPLATRAALEGRNTFVEYNDYRGVPVLAATQYIPATGWGMVNKIDRAEAYENVRQMAVVEELAAGLLIILLGGLLAFHRRTVLMRALKQKEGEFRALLESAPDAMAITDREGRIVLVNAQAEILFGFGRNELIGQTLGMLFPEWARERSGGGGPEDFSEVAARHVGRTFEMRGLRKGGKESPFEVRLSPVKEIEGGLFSCGIRDITQRKQAEQALARERDLLCALMDNSPDYIYFKDYQSRFLRTNLAHAKALGLSDSSQAVGKTDFDFFPQEDAKSYFSDERQVIQTGQPLIGRVEKVRQADGQLRWVSTTKVPTRDAQGRITGLVGITRDITEHQRAQAELAERHRLARLMVEVGATLTGAESLRQGLQQCTEVLVREIDAAFARVWTVNEAESGLELQASAGMYTHINGGHARVPMGKFKIGRIAESGEPHLTNTVREDSWVGDPEWARREGMVAFAGYPLKVGERVLGVVAAFARQPLTPATLQAFASVAHNLAQFIERKGAEEELRLTQFSMEHASDSIFWMDPQGRIVYVNEAACRTLERSREELLSLSIPDIDPNLSPRDWGVAWEKVKVLGSLTLETCHQTKRGRVFPVEVTSNYIEFRGKEYSSAFARDITERKRAEQQINLQATALKAVANGIVIVGREGNILWVNPAFTRLTGYSAGEAIGQNPRLLKSGVHDAAFYAGLWQTILKDGTRYTEELIITPVRDAHGAISHLVAIMQDVTERKRAEADVLRYAQDLETEKAAQEENSAELTHLVEELAHERDLLGTLMDNVPDAIYFKDSQSRFTRINASQARVLGVADSRAALGKTDFDFFPPEDAQAYYAMERKIIESGEPVIGALERHSDASGKFQWLSNTEVPVKDAQGRVTGIVGVARDVTEWKSTLEAFRESEERYRELFENASDLVYTSDLEGRITSLNRVAVQTLGYSLEEAVQMNLRQLLAPQHWPRIEQFRVDLLGGDSPSSLELEITAKDGREVRLEVKPRLIYKDGKPVGVQGIGRDITGREVAEMELLHAQKLEAVGRLASGIAHEINTPIQFVGDNTRFLQDSFGCLQGLLNKYQEFLSTAASGTLRPDFLAEVRRAEEEADFAYLREEIPKALTQTLEGITRVSSIVRAMKDFAHPESKEMAAADLNKALLSTLTVARNELKYVSDVETDFGDLPLVVCNVGDLNQVFLNLLVNAAHAISDVVKGTGAKGKIRVRTVLEGKTVLITISDTGGGIPEAIRARIYDPFFTTKEVGRGTGQGLAIARSMVVNRHKGSLTFESEVGKGTTFYIRLPLDPTEYSKETKAP